MKPVFKIFLTFFFFLFLNFVAYTQQDITIRANATELLSGSGVFDIGDVYVGYEANYFFIVENTGDMDLTMDASTPIAIGGTHASEFSTANELASEVISGGSLNVFDITILATSTGSKSGTITVSSDDPDEGTYTFTVNANAIEKPLICNIPGGDFENAYNGSFPEGFLGFTGVKEFESPPGWSPLFGALFALFGSEVNVSISSDARTGSGALELIGNSNGLGDLFTSFPCEASSSATLKGFYKFSGAATDSAVVVVSSGGGGEANRTDANSDTLYIQSDATDYTSFEIPVPYDANSVDSLLVYLYTTSNATATFLLDDLEIEVAGEPEPSSPFITTWQTDNFGSSTDTQITIPTEGAGYNYDIYWEEVGNTSNNGSLNGQTGDVTIDFGASGTYSVQITGDFPRIYFNNENDINKILSVDQWGDIAWTSMENSFYGCHNLDVAAEDLPDLSAVTDMSYMFSSVNQAFTSTVIGNWDVSTVTNMSHMFFFARFFNSDIGDWDVSSVENMFRMFDNVNGGVFNQDISNWNVGNVTIMHDMFHGNVDFNQDISQWDVSSVEDMTDMFYNASSFDQNLGNWDVSSLMFATRMLTGTNMSVSNYDQTLIGWAAISTLQNNVNFTSDRELCAATDAKQTLISNFSWTITDNGASDPVPEVESLDDITGQCSVAEPASPTATNCNDGSTLMGVPDVSFPVTSQGTTTITWTFDDGSGGVTTQQQNIIIDDTEAPVADVEDLADLTASCTVAEPTAPTATDNCAGTINGVADVTFPITAQGTTVVTWTYSDGNGNSTTQTQNVIITDESSPVADEASLDDLTGTCSVDMPSAPTATDNCDGTITGEADATFPITTHGTTVVTWTYTDESGNSATQTQNVIISDTESPVADETALTDLTATCSVTEPTAPTATDNCEGSITGVTDADFPITAKGTTTITWTYDDGNGNTTTQTQNVVITDLDAPEPTQEELQTITVSCELTSISTPTASNNCDGTINGESDTTLPITTLGTTTITWTYTDSEGNSSTQEQVVNVIDDEAPDPGVAEFADFIGECDSPINEFAPVRAVDNCAGDVFATSDVSFPLTTIGETIVTWTYDDGNGNTTVLPQKFIIPQSYTISVDTSICEGSDFTLPDGTVWNGQSTYTSSLSTQYGCDSVITTNITVLPIPTVDLGDDEVFACVGEELTFSIDESSIEFITYTISTLFGNSSTDGPLTFTFDQTFASTASTQDVFVTIELTDENGCVGTDEVLLKDNTMKNWAIGGIQNNDPEILIGNTILPETHDSFEWDFGDGTTNNVDINPSHTYSENGDYTITLTVSNECGDESLTTNISIMNADTSEPLGVDLHKVSVYPNPTTRFVNLNFDQPIKVSVYGLDGKRYLSKMLGVEEPLDLEHLLPGHYILNLHVGEKLIDTHKIIKIN